MSFVLPKEVLQSKSLNSLDGDLKSIAEQLIADKFGCKEEVLEQSSASFRHGYTTTQFEYSADRVYSKFATNFQRKVERIAISDPRSDYLFSTIRSLFNEGYHPRDLTIYMHPQCFNDYRRMPELWGSGDGTYYFFDVKIVVVPWVRCIEIEVVS